MPTPDPTTRHHPLRPLTARRAGAVLLATAVLAVAGAGAARAHVNVIPEKTSAGAFTKLTFRVPTESDTASTTKLRIDLPTDTPLAFVTAQQLDGWQVEVTTSTLPEPVEVQGSTLTEAPTSVTWTADAGRALGPDQFQEFSLSGGPLPTGVGEIAFPATQTYSDGTVVEWNEPHPEGAAEPEHPVPAFELTAAAPAGADADASGAGSEAAEGGGEVTADDTAARWLGGAGLAAGLAGLALGLVAWRRSSPTDPPPGSDPGPSVGSRP